jgi:hypothetical protein
MDKEEMTFVVKEEEKKIIMIANEALKEIT